MYELILENATSSKINASEDILAQIAQVVQECAQFIAKYSETKNFCMLPPLRVLMRVLILFERAPTWQEYFLGDGHQSCQLQLKVGYANARVPRSCTF